MILDDEDILIQAAIDSACYKMVDLGLPSGLKWADRNIGAFSPEDAGLYFQWGDTIGYTADQVGKDKTFNWESYFDTTDRGDTFNIYNNNGGLTVLLSADDAATVHMGSQYRMPTVDEIRELMNNTKQTFIDLNDNGYSKIQAKNGAIKSRKLKGVRFTGSNGNSIFIPAAGYCADPCMNDIGVSGTLWSSSLSGSYNGCARSLNFYYDADVYDISDRRNYGTCVRGVE